MERGRNFRLLAEEELPRLLDFLVVYLPESLKVRAIFPRDFYPACLLLTFQSVKRLQ